MFHYFNAITNTKGDALIGYYVRVTNAGVGVPLYADASLTPIISVSGIADAAKVDHDGNVDFYVNTGTYRLDIYATDGTTLVKSIKDVGMEIDVSAGVQLNGIAQGFASRAALAGANNVALKVAELTEAGREGTFVWSSANESIGVTRDTQQGVYVPPTSAPTGASGAWVRKFDGQLNVRWFGAKGDGVTDDTAAFNGALNTLLVARTSPPGFAGYGVGAIYIPKGNYLINGTITVASPLGLRFMGDTEATTTLTTTLDAGNMFSLATYANVTFEHILFNHSTATARASWTNSLFSIGSTGTGREFRLMFCQTEGFNRVIDYFAGISAGNDTNRAFGCTFSNYNTFLFARSSQAVNNWFGCCTWKGGASTSVGFDVAAYQNTTIQTGNHTAQGTFIVLADVASIYNESCNFALDQMKFEWTADNVAAGSTPKIISAVGVNTVAHVTLRNVSLFGGSVPNADARWGYVQRPYMTVENGRLDGKLQIAPHNSNTTEQRAAVHFRRTMLSDPSAWVYDVAGAGNTYPQIVFEDARVPGAQPVNLTLTKNLGACTIRPARTITLANTTSPEAFFAASTTVQMNYPVYGQLVWVKSVNLSVRSAAAGTVDRTINVYKDAGRTSLVATATTGTGALSNQIINVPITGGTFTTTDGIYVDIVSPASTTSLRAVVLVDFVSG